MVHEDASLDHASTPSLNYQPYQAVRDYCSLKRYQLYHCLQSLIQIIGTTPLNWQLYSSKILNYRIFEKRLAQAELAALENLHQIHVRSVAWLKAASSAVSPETKTSGEQQRAGSRRLFISALYRLFIVLQLRMVYLRFTVKRIMLLFQETEVMVKEVSRLAEVEAAIEPPVNFADLPDIRQLGGCGVEQRTIILNDEQRDFSRVTQRKGQFRVLLYTPQRWRTGKTPVVVISHGLGSRPEAFRDYAKHLTSYGYMVALPQHSGSDAERIWQRLTGQSQDIFNLEEFIDRPLDITYVLNQLEQRNHSEYNGRLDLENVGVMGHSFGGYTALTLAGAEINFEDLNTVCALTPGLPNLSLLLQCRALELPRRSYSFRDQRVKAILSLDPVGSEVFGAKGLRPIQIPVLIVAGSEDNTTPAVFEQIRLFPWLTTAHRYLALIEGKAHIGTFSDLDANLNLVLRRVTNLKGLNSSIFYSYINSLSLAFFEVYLADNLAYAPYLQSSYAKYISQSPFHLSLISAASCRTASCDLIDQRLREFILQISKLN